MFEGKKVEKMVLQPPVEEIGGLDKSGIKVKQNTKKRRMIKKVRGVKGRMTLGENLVKKLKIKGN